LSLDIEVKSVITSQKIKTHRTADKYFVELNRQFMTKEITIDQYNQLKTAHDINMGYL